MTITGLERLTQHKKNQESIKGNVALLCHSASIDRNFVLAATHFKNIFKQRFVKLFGPQHGFVTDVQDNMVETKHFHHPYFDVPVYSLYSETRVPTDEMLENIDTIVVDLQDVGTRVYTYINTMTLLMEACGKKNIKVVVLDRPNPIGGIQIEGNLLEKGLESFVGRHPIPMRHALTIGEMAIFAKRYYNSDCELEVISMKEWSRSFYFNETGLPWIPPSPNLPTPEGAITFPGTVLLEGTNLSEGRGTTRSLEVIGFPRFSPYTYLDELQDIFKKNQITSPIFRPINFYPMFQKHEKQTCGGYHIHITDLKNVNSWLVGQILIHFFKERLDGLFQWNTNTYEYESEFPAIDYINGTNKIRHLIDNNFTIDKLKQIESNGAGDYKEKIQNIFLYQ